MAGGHTASHGSTSLFQPRTLFKSARSGGFVLRGDVNRDRAVNGSDFALLAGSFGKSAWRPGQMRGAEHVESRYRRPSRS